MIKKIAIALVILFILFEISKKLLLLAVTVAVIWVILKWLWGLVNDTKKMNRENPDVLRLDQ
jgi:ABC-type bacteriocin/lantibiotic exporter with double-glycine peptidase domain